MSNDDFLERLRNDAAQLRYEPRDQALWTRLAARIRQRVRTQTSVSQLLARWFRPITASLAALALAAALSITWFERVQPASTLEAMSSSSVEISVGGDTYNLAE